MPTTVRVFANPTLPSLERARLALEAEHRGVNLSTLREGGATVAVAVWSAETFDAAETDRLRGLLVESLGTVERPADLWRRTTTATLERIVADLADVIARLDRIEQILQQPGAAPKITGKP